MGTNSYKVFSIETAYRLGDAHHVQVVVHLTRQLEFVRLVILSNLTVLGSLDRNNLGAFLSV